MDEKKYEPGKVEISSEEYRDLVKEAVEARRDASDIRSEKWRVESERDKLKKELEAANKKIAELEGIINTLQQACVYSNMLQPSKDSHAERWQDVNCLLQTNNKEDT